MAKIKCEVTGGEYDPGSYSDFVHQFIAADNETSREQAFRDLQSVPIWPGGTLFELDAHSNAELAARDTPEQRSVIDSRFVAFSNLFVAAGHHAEALRFLTHLYRLMRRTEIRTSSRWMKGSPLFFLGASFLAAGNRLDAESGLVLAMIEDAISEAGDPKAKPAKEQPACKALVRELGLAQETVDRLADAVVSRARSNRTWDVRDPERVYLQALCSPEFWLRDRAPLPFVLEVADQFLVKMRDAATSHEKGVTLELLAAYLFETAGRFRVAVRAAGSDAENDLLVLNLHEKPLSIMGEYFVVSCKNWPSDKVDVSEIRNLHDRLDEYGCNSGVLIARSGITDGALEQVGKKERRILVLDLSSLEYLAKGRDRLPQLLVDRYFKRVFNLFDKSKS